jgi:hypothetical protein
VAGEGEHHFASLNYGQIVCVAPKHPSPHSRHASEAHRWPTGKAYGKRVAKLAENVEMEPCLIGVSHPAVWQVGRLGNPCGITMETIQRVET